MPNTVTLRDVTVDDLPILCEQQLNPTASKMAAFPSRAWDEFLPHWTSILANDAGDKQVILYDGQVAGNIVAFDHNGEREVGYWLGAEYWGKGIATQALALFLPKLQTRPLVAHVAVHNIGSLRVLQKNGFIIVGEEPEEDEATGETLIIRVLRLDANA